jgi:hypothetical protein
MAILIVALPLCAVNVGGWITEDTVWGIEGSPYVVESYLYVGEGATLSIEAGVQVLVKGGYASGNWDDFRWSGTTDEPVEPVAKRIIVHGGISAQGTAQDPVVFDTYEQDPLYNWSGVEIAPGAMFSSFEYCQFKRTFVFYLFPSNEWRTGALFIFNGKIHIRNCEFTDNWGGICTYFPGMIEDALVYGCKFYASDLSAYTFEPYAIVIYSHDETVHKLTIAGCEFSGFMKDIQYYGMELLVLNNKYIDYIDPDTREESDPRWTYIQSWYGNESVNSRIKLNCSSNVDTVAAFARRNRIIYDDNTGDYAEIGIHSPASPIMTDNYVRGNVRTTFGPNSLVHNNVFETSIRYMTSITVEGSNDGPVLDLPRIYNNEFRSVNQDSTFSRNALICLGNTPMIFNNTVVNYSGINNVQGYGNPRFLNNIFDGYSQSIYPGNCYVYPQVFYNNCLELPIPSDPYPYDGGGNIVAAPLYADSLGGDFSLGADSPCIDAGLGIPELPVYDIRYHKRVAPGTPGAPEVVDMGAYEYNSVYIGGIRLYVCDAHTQAAVDCARIDIDGMLPEFSDASGRRVFPTGEGTFTVRVSRWDYADLVIPNVVVAEGENTSLFVPLQPTTVENGDTVIPSAGSTLGLANYPNPFSGGTRISFILPEAGDASLEVYNLRGQKVRTLAGGNLGKGYHDYFWDGRDERGASVSSGIYLVRCGMGSATAYSKVMLVR